MTVFVAPVDPFIDSHGSQNSPHHRIEVDVHLISERYSFEAFESRKGYLARGFASSHFFTTPVTIKHRSVEIEGIVKSEASV
jgi:hypothetical protein